MKHEAGDQNRTGDLPITNVIEGVRGGTEYQSHVDSIARFGISESHHNTPKQPQKQPHAFSRLNFPVSA